MTTRKILVLAMALGSAAAVSAQSAIDAYNITPTQLRGTARFVGMGGAFTSLGSDISCMTQNPAGLGLYRHSDIGLTFDISMRNYKTATSDRTNSNSETKLRFDNFGYVGVINLNGIMRSFQWGVSYNRLASFDRLTSAYNLPTSTSLTNYIASYTNGIPSSDLIVEEKFDPYFDTSNDWLSILAYNSFMISNPGANQEEYRGLFQNGTKGDALSNVRERGYSDEYNIDFAGNVSDIFFWGLGIGIVDMDYRREVNYSESMDNALVYNHQTESLSSGKANFNLYNWQQISGSGANLKLGVIFRPIEMLRIGLAVHTPTWLRLTHTTYAQTDYEFLADDAVGDNPTNEGDFSTPDNNYDSRLTTPWRFMIGASLVVGPKAIISLDYERVAYDAMKLKQQSYFGGDYNYGGGFTDNTYANEDVKNYFRAANIIRVGAEYRINRNWSVRAGYNYQSGNVRKEASDGNMYISTAGTDPSYRFDNDVQNITLGLGYRYKSWYADIAYQHTSQSAQFHAYTPFGTGNDWHQSPSAKVTDKYNNIVISTGFKF
ncbi:MAG: outer membrane protein transport protein [Muribaculaceae bacterium]|nr:outer membrane protein transport protein [Muribaculaceae bacterium]